MFHLKIEINKKNLIFSLTNFTYKNKNFKTAFIKLSYSLIILEKMYRNVERNNIQQQ